MLGHMQKVNHFWVQIKKTQNVSEDFFSQSSSIAIQNYGQSEQCDFH